MKNHFMSNKLLLPNKYKKIGWFILVPSFIIGVYLLYAEQPIWLNGKIISIFPTWNNEPFFTTIQVNFAKTIVGVAFIIGGLLVGFSKEKNEDEFIEKLRLSSLLWAVFVNYTLLIIAFLLVYDIPFLTVMTYNMFTVLIIFIVRFNYILYINSKSLSNAE
jgi:hypothetical protein